ncbi:vegetative cell wall protein gp1-like [Parambassis ranga]|uniref:Vegetative cell wall protein gp1-like n=1 Tax=Parambassis ranga TaxID=210632 RepID=A0A6P7K523_9TELE|nr:vegetative cell wall protein gp1-like [Parambassis ranga]
MTRKEKGKQAALCLAVVLTCCCLVPTIHCSRLRKIQREGRRAGAAATRTADQEGTIVFGEVFLSQQASDKTAKSLFQDEAGYQADSTGLSSTPTPVAPEAAWKRMTPSLQCSGDQLRFKLLGPGASQLSVLKGPASPVPLSQVPSTCGYNMHRNSLALVLQVPFDGCNVIQEGGSYVLPLQWQGFPLSLWCSKPSASAPATAPPATAPPTTAPPTPEPQTTAPPTPEPQTTAPPTPEPQTTAPPTPEPQTTAPPTPEPQTTADQTPGPQTPSNLADPTNPPVPPKNPDPMYPKFPPYFFFPPQFPQYPAVPVAPTPKKKGFPQLPYFFPPMYPPYFNPPPMYYPFFTTPAPATTTPATTTTTSTTTTTTPMPTTTTATPAATVPPQTFTFPSFPYMFQNPMPFPWFPQPTGETDTAQAIPAQPLPKFVPKLPYWFQFPIPQPQYPQYPVPLTTPAPATTTAYPAEKGAVQLVYWPSFH